MAVRRAPTPTEQPVTTLVSRLGSDVGRIVRAEIALVQLRLTVILRGLQAASVGLVVCALLAMAGVGALIGGLVLLIAQWIPAWVSAFAVGGCLLVIAALIGVSQTRRLQIDVRDALAPGEAMHGE